MLRRIAIALLTGEAQIWLGQTGVDHLGMADGIGDELWTEGGNMTECDKTGAPANAMNNEEVTVFDVEDDGVLSVSDFCAPTKRRDLYFVSLACSKSARALVEAIEECWPLAWKVHRVYEEFRVNLESDLDNAEYQRPRSVRKITKLKAMLEAMPPDPEKGVKQWLPTLSKKVFAETMTEWITKWFDDEPDWTFEGDS